MSDIDFTPIIVTKGNWRVALEYKGEGYCGKFDASIDEYHDASDSPIINITVYTKLGKNWSVVKYGCQRTYLLATDDVELLAKCAKLILDKVCKYEDWSNDNNNRSFLCGLGYTHLRGEKICFKEDLVWSKEDDD